jgi:hypothetical protein
MHDVRGDKGSRMPARSLTFQTENLYNLIVDDSGSSGNFNSRLPLLEILYARFHTSQLDTAVYTK